MSDEPHSQGQISYELHYRQGLSWNKVAKRLGISREAARKSAYRYADHNQLPRPPRTPKGKIEKNEPFVNVSDKRVGNERILTSYSPMITTPDELIEFCKIDLTKWIIAREEATAWTTPSKDIEKDLKITDSVVTGTIRQSSDMRFGQNIRVFVSLLPRHPEKIYPVIEQVEVAASYRKPVHVTRSIFTRHLILGDTQFGFRKATDGSFKPLINFHDRRVLDIALQIAEVAQPDHIHFLGDLFDMSEFTDKFTKSGDCYFTLQPALDEAFWWLIQFSDFSKTSIHEGNHDKRLPYAIRNHLPFAYQLRPATLSQIVAPAVLSIESLLNLGTLGITWIPDYPKDQVFLAPSLVINHGLIARAGSVETARAVAKGYLSEIFGHIHRREYSTGVRRDATGLHEVTGVSFGCACYIDHRVPGHKPTQDWSQGIGIVDVYPDGSFDIQPIAIYEGEAAYNGQRFTARDRLDDLRADLPRWNW